ncbi:MAG: hypothetical protein TR69_WS6001000577 [candidate division WS6 bacterium OLB20]|uniref:Uncharacterized protein n=1 Tax=candidate division WS6 bacterium OLB20 TaxID=1617426 RepID=A0A136LY50_9BACT|nr:MAG: hypothetical protein TR69_WS6001000577 [candidate division WS6 bacterium OLB20]
MTKSTVPTVLLLLAVITLIAGGFFYLFAREQRQASQAAADLDQDLYGYPFETPTDSTFTEITRGTVQSVSTSVDLRDRPRNPESPAQARSRQ